MQRQYDKVESFEVFWSSDLWQNTYVEEGGKKKQEGQEPEEEKKQDAEEEGEGWEGVNGHRIPGHPKASLGLESGTMYHESWSRHSLTVLSLE